MDKKEGETSMNPDELSVNLVINERANKKLQLLREKQKERFIKQKTAMDEYIKTGNMEEKKEAYKINKIWDEFDILYGLVMDLTDLNLSLHKKVIIQENIIDVISTQTHKSPESEKQISIMMKKVEELEQFQKHVLETVANKPLPKETKAQDMMIA